MEEKFKHLSLSEILEIEGFSTLEDFLDEYVNSSTVPAMCSCGEWVETDGHCPHGNESLFLYLGII